MNRTRKQPICKYCHRPIFWRRTDRGMVAIEDDGRLHDCPARKQETIIKTVSASDPVEDVGIQITGVIMDEFVDVPKDDAEPCQHCGGTVVGRRCINCDRRQGQKKHLPI